MLVLTDSTTLWQHFLGVALRAHSDRAPQHSATTTSRQCPFHHFCRSHRRRRHGQYTRRSRHHRIQTHHLLCRHLRLHQSHQSHRRCHRRRPILRLPHFFPYRPVTWSCATTLAFRVLTAPHPPPGHLTAPVMTVGLVLNGQSVRREPTAPTAALVMFCTPHLLAATRHRRRHRQHSRAKWSSARTPVRQTRAWARTWAIPSRTATVRMAGRAPRVPRATLAPTVTIAAFVSWRPRRLPNPRCLHRRPRRSFRCHHRRRSCLRRCPPFLRHRRHQAHRRHRLHSRTIRPHHQSVPHRLLLRRHHRRHRRHRRRRHRRQHRRHRQFRLLRLQLHHAPPRRRPCHPPWPRHLPSVPIS